MLGPEESEPDRPATSRPWRRGLTGSRVLGLVCGLFCGIIAFMNAATATQAGFRIFFLICGIAIISGGVLLIRRWRL